MRRAIVCAMAPLLEAEWPPFLETTSRIKARISSATWRRFSGGPFFKSWGLRIPSRSLGIGGLRIGLKKGRREIAELLGPGRESPPGTNGPADQALQPFSGLLFSRERDVIGPVRNAGFLFPE